MSMLLGMLVRRLVVIFVCLLKVTALYALDYDYRTFDVQPHPIQFLSQPNDHYTFPRADVTFVCSVTSFNGFPNILWFFNNAIIKSGYHYNISNDAHTTNTLIIRNVSTEDQGDYHCCIGEWKTKIRSRSGQLFVIDDGNTSNYDDGNIRNYNINAVYKSTVVLPCHLKLDIKPIWIQNQLRLDSKTTFIDEGGNLVLVNVSEDHSGHYQCQVSKSGTIRNGSSYVLTVQTPIGNLDHESGKSSSQYLLIIPNHCGKSPHNQTVTLQCPVTGHPSPIINWYLNGELVNLTDYNITDNVGNNTWIIQGGDPCRLIGYWQCFATNEAGTVHNEIRVLPYGWINPPGRPTLKVANLSEDLMYYLISAHVNITWSPPQYLGGLDASDIYYQLHATDYDINTTNTYAVLLYDEVDLSIDKKALDLSIMIHYNGSKIDTLYIPSNIIEKKRYDNLLCDAIEFKPPQIFTQCFENGTFYASWSLPDQELSITYVEYFQYGWFLSGNCTNNNILLEYSVLKDQFYGHDYINIIISSMERISCTYEVRPRYNGCDCGMSCQSSFTCAYPNVSPTSTVVLPAATAMTTNSKEIDNTATDSPSVTTSKSVTITDPIIITTQSTLSSRSTAVINPTAVTTQSTSNGSSTITSIVSSFPTSSGGGTSSTALYITIGVLLYIISVLLIGSITTIIFTVLYIYRWKRCKRYAVSTEKYEDF